MGKAIFIGVDIGTSGVRAIAINADAEIEAEYHTPLPAPRTQGNAVEQSPELWWEAVKTVLRNIISKLDRSAVKTISVDGTSGTTLLTDSELNPVTPGLMYNDNRAGSEAERISRIAPRESAAHGTGSGLAKLLWLLPRCDHTPVQVHTQSDWITSRLSGVVNICDANNALKLGYDPITRRWPTWLNKLGLPDMLLPEVVPAGQTVGTLQPGLADEWGLDESVLIVSGTTDSTAAFIASGASQTGEAVTALGSTLVLKVISETPVFAPEFGVYSHPLGDKWLVGGASNSGGAVLRQFFSDEQMAQLTLQLKPEHPTGLDYYPLPSTGERFPVNDPGQASCTSPRPESDEVFFQALLEGIAQIEKAGYEKLAELGAPYPVSVRSNGGGAKNNPWTSIRGNKLGIPMIKAARSQAAYGSALLALKGHSAV